MTVEHVGTAWAEAADESLRTAIEASDLKSAPLLMRLNFDLYDRTKQTYVKWRGQIWKVEVDQDKEAQAIGLRDALSAFFQLYGLVGAEAARVALVCAADDAKHQQAESDTAATPVPTVAEGDDPGELVGEDPPAEG